MGTKQLTIGCLVLTAVAMAQQPSAPKQEPPVKVSVLNVCTPTDEEQRDIAAALRSIARQPRFAADYEVARGHSTVEGSSSDWVRVRREYASGAFTAAQFLFSGEPQATRETIVFFSREAKPVTQIALEDKVTPPVAATTLLKTNTPVDRISVERFGKSHLVLARCVGADQAKYEPLFHAATEIMTAYRTAVGAREIVPAELGRLSLGVGPGYRPPRVKPMQKR